MPSVALMPFAALVLPAASIAVDGVRPRARGIPDGFHGGRPDPRPYRPGLPVPSTAQRATKSTRYQNGGSVPGFAVTPRPVRVGVVPKRHDQSPASVMPVAGSGVRVPPHLHRSSTLNLLIRPSHQPCPAGPPRRPASSNAPSLESTTARVRSRRPDWRPRKRPPRSGCPQYG